MNLPRLFAADVRKIVVRHLTRGLYATVIAALLVLTLKPSVHAQELPTVLPTNVKIVHFPSATLGEDRTMLVMLPVNYEHTVRRYPVLYLLHGHDADITDWARGTNLSDYATRHELIIVTPDASRGWYVNSVANHKAHFEDFIMNDVIAYIDKTFRTIPEPFARHRRRFHGWVRCRLFGSEAPRSVRRHRQLQRRPRSGARSITTLTKKCNGPRQKK